mgnify:CR=1 FL=1
MIRFFIFFWLVFYNDILHWLLFFLLYINHNGSFFLFLFIFNNLFFINRFSFNHIDTTLLCYYFFSNTSALFFCFTVISKEASP